MFEKIDPATAASRHWDVVIAGSAFSAMFFLHGLPQDLSVLIVEKGGIQDYDSQLKNGIAGEEDFRQRDTSGDGKRWVAHSTFGGNSNCWWGCTPRFHPSDFRMQSLYGVAEDWPLTYDDLEPFYTAVETIMEISGGGSDHILPRTAPFPFPPHHPSRTDRLLRRKSADWFAQPTARSNGGSRPNCCANGVCDLCPIEAKFTIKNGIDHFQRPQAALLTGTEIRAVRVEGGRATGVLARSDGKEFEIKADLVSLGANAVFNAAILMRSDIDLPGIGRGLNEQVSRFVEVDAPGLGPFGGTAMTGHGYVLYDGPHRRDHSGLLLEIYNAPMAIRPTRGRWLERTRINMIAEDLPQDRNRVVLEDDEPVIEWSGHHSYALDALDWGGKKIPELFDNVEGYFAFGNSRTEAHMLGTHRMGDDPALHVVDDHLRCLSVKNLYVLGGGAFPSSSMANPTLTISALALRAGGTVS